MISQLPHGAMLERKTGGHINELGSLAFWAQALHELYAQMPFKPLFDRLLIIVWHMNHPDLDAMRKKQIANLEDYDPKKPHCQVARGLFHSWHPNYPGKLVIEIGMFPSVWNEDTTGWDAIDPGQLAIGRSVLSHEMGHLYGHMSGYGKPTSINYHMEQVWAQYRPKQGHNEYEDWAEVYRAVCGAKDAIGTFSDGKNYIPPHQLHTLMKTAYWLHAALKDKAIAKFDCISAHENYAQWAERSGHWWFPFYKDSWRKIATDWTLYEWILSEWSRS